MPSKARSTRSRDDDLPTFAPRALVAFVFPFVVDAVAARGALEDLPSRRVGEVEVQKEVDGPPAVERVRPPLRGSLFGDEERCPPPALLVVSALRPVRPSFS
jgi:hypothetical protein